MFVTLSTASMGGTRVGLKCATAVRLCAARVAHVRRPTTPNPSQRARVSSVGKTPSFGFCQVDMYAICFFSEGPFGWGRGGHVPHRSHG